MTAVSSRRTARFDVDHGEGEARIAAIEGGYLRTRRGHLPERARQRGRRRDEVDGVAPAQSGQQPPDHLDDCSDLRVGHEFESVHRLDRDVPFEIERGLGKEIAEGAPGRERPGEHGRHRGGSWAREQPELGAQCARPLLPRLRRQTQKDLLARLEVAQQRRLVHADLFGDLGQGDLPDSPFAPSRRAASRIAASRRCFASVLRARWNPGSGISEHNTTGLRY